MALDQNHPLVEREILTGDELPLGNVHQHGARMGMPGEHGTRLDGEADQRQVGCILLCESGACFLAQIRHQSLLGQAVFVEAVALGQVLTEDAGSPLAEACGAT